LDFFFLFFSVPPSSLFFNRFPPAVPRRFVFLAGPPPFISVDHFSPVPLLHCFFFGFIICNKCRFPPHVSSRVRSPFFSNIPQIGRTPWFDAIFLGARPSSLIFMGSFLLPHFWFHFPLFLYPPPVPIPNFYPRLFRPFSPTTYFPFFPTPLTEGVLRFPRFFCFFLPFCCDPLSFSSFFLFFVSDALCIHSHLSPPPPRPRPRGIRWFFFRG